MEVKQFLNLPLLVEQDEDWVWVAESPIFNGFFTQWHTLSELKANVQEVSEMYFDMINEWEKPFNTQYLINLKYNKDGKITNDFSKEINQTVEKKVIWTS